MRIRTWRRYAALLALLLPLSFGGCEVSCDTNDNPIEEAGDEIEEATDEVGDELEEATDGG